MFVIKIQLLLLIPKYISILLYKSIAKCTIWETNHSEYNMRNSPQPVRWIILRGPLRSSARWKMREHPVKSFCILLFPFFFFLVCVYTALPFREYSASARARKHFTNYTVCNKKCKTLYRPSWKLDFCFERLFCWQRFFSKSVYYVNMKRKLAIRFIKKSRLLIKIR